MIDFFTSILNNTDIPSILGDMYEPVCAVIISGGFLIPLAFTCDLFCRLVSSLFKGGKN